MRAGVSPIPSTFAMVQLTMAAASFPLLHTVSTTADEMVVGKHNAMISPSNNFGDRLVVDLSALATAAPNRG